MYNDMVSKIWEYRFSFMEENRLDVFDLCDYIIMHPNTYYAFLREGNELMSPPLHIQQRTLFGITLKASPIVEENNFRFILKNT